MIYYTTLRRILEDTILAGAGGTQAWCFKTFEWPSGVRTLDLKSGEASRGSALLLKVAVVRHHGLDRVYNASGMRRPRTQAC